ncbi:phosphoribosyl-AMP cyclohydrolase [Hahella sp. SMD15-11]|uniref:Phosphoribosyl-AMP cyclohydrolase n=1 Tax=Thermohahella caldifontis TaxID=3142973 RepID=A0AB39UW09_9GAMM
MTETLPDLSTVRFNADGLIPAIAQDVHTGDVLMLAWMNRDALEETLRSGTAVYWSRSRQALWRKGESSGHVQKVHALYLDCDADTVLMKVEQVGGIACHTGRRNCFFLERHGDQWVEAHAPVKNPEDIYGDNHGH